MTGLRPFFTYYGGKWRAAPRYPAPLYADVFEPFAGSAGYSLRHYERHVVLAEKDERIFWLWKYLIRVSAAELLSLPDVPTGGSVDDLHVCEEAKSLIGFWLNKGAAQPCKTPSAWMRSGIRPNSYWGPQVRGVLAAQAGKISHWKIVDRDYSTMSMKSGTWFVDPPYAQAGRLYRHSSKDIDYVALARWCRDLRGQVLVCENVGASWLPFRPFLKAKSTPGSRGKGHTQEALWESL